MLLALFLWKNSSETPLPEGISSEDYESVRTSLKKATGTEPTQAEVLFTLAKSLESQGDYDSAGRCFEAVSGSDSHYGLRALLESGKLQIKLNHATAAESSLRKFLEYADQDPDIKNSQIAEALDWLKYLMSIELRFEERTPLLKKLHELGYAKPQHSLQYLFPHLLLWNSVKGRDKIRACLQETPGDPHLLIAHGRYLTGAGKLEDSRVLLEALVEKIPTNPACLAALLECHFERNDWNSFEAVLTKYKPEDKEDWLLMLMKGEYALHEQHWEQAAFHFEKLLEEDRGNVTASMGLAQAYQELGQNEKSEQYRQQTRVLSRIRPQLSKLLKDDPESFAEIAQQCESIGYDDAARILRLQGALIGQQVPFLTAPEN
ncbi:MAG: hypothetical protein HUJ26_15930 [Planctomycetaceae bacterium]|nr:hypothetical protein [Planctomycetaceae bacterium]